MSTFVSRLPAWRTLKSLPWAPSTSSFWSWCWLFVTSAQDDGLIEMKTKQSFTLACSADNSGVGADAFGSVVRQQMWWRVREGAKHWAGRGQEARRETSAPQSSSRGRVLVTYNQFSSPFLEGSQEHHRGSACNRKALGTILDPMVAVPWFQAGCFCSFTWTLWASHVCHKDLPP